MSKFILVLVFALLLAPLYFMLIGSFQDIHGVMSMPPSLIPHNPIMGNYERMLAWPLAKWLSNTLFVVFFTVLISVSISATAGYAFAFYKFPLKKTLWTLFLVGIMIPRISLLIPHYIIVRKLGIQGGLWAVILPACFSPVGLYLARTYFETVPKSLLESARLDGCNEIQVLFHVVAPVSKPIVTALSLFAALASLQDYVWQSLVLLNPSRQTLIVGMIKAVMSRGGTMENVNPLGRSFAVGIVLLFPLLVVFLAANKYFVNSLTGACKE